MVQSLVKRGNLKQSFSINYYYSKQKKLLAQSEDDFSLNEIYHILGVHKLSADFNFSFLNKIKPSKTVSRDSNLISD